MAKEFNPEEIENLPPCLINVDKEGRLWHQGVQMTHEGINSLLMAHVEMDSAGRYIINFNKQRCYVEVEDTFFVITSLSADLNGQGKPETLHITLNDGTRETLDPSTLNQNPDHVMYADVKNKSFPARFLRSSYYQLAEYAEEKGDLIVLAVGGREYELI